MTFGPALRKRFFETCCLTCKIVNPRRGTSRGRRARSPGQANCQILQERAFLFEAPFRYEGEGPSRDLHAEAKISALGSVVDSQGQEERMEEMKQQIEALEGRV